MERSRTNEIKNELHNQIKDPEDIKLYNKGV